MDQQCEENVTLSAIRGLVRTIVGRSEPGDWYSGGGTYDCIGSSAPGGFYSCFQDPVSWAKHYMRGFGSCPYVDAFWKACIDGGVEFSPVGVAGYDEDLNRMFGSQQALQELASRVHFHWSYTDASAYECSKPEDESDGGLGHHADFNFASRAIGGYSSGRLRKLLQQTSTRILGNGHAGQQRFGGRLEIHSWGVRLQQ